MLRKIISGGQTGADTGGLLGARDFGVLTGGWAPKDFRTEYGNKPEFLKSFGLKDSGVYNYNIRTERNIIEADATVICSRMPFSPGTKATIDLCRINGKPYLLNPRTPEKLADFIRSKNVNILNVAGNRESVATGIQENVRRFIGQTIEILRSTNDVQTIQRS